MRTLFGYKTYLVDEFRTSCKCSKCDGGSCEKYMTRENPNHSMIILDSSWVFSCKNCLMCGIEIVMEQQISIII